MWLWWGVKFHNFKYVINLFCNIIGIFNLMWHVPFSTSALMLMVRNRSSSFSYNIPRDALLSSVLFGLRVVSRRRDRNMDDEPAGGAIPPPSKPSAASANLRLHSRCTLNCTKTALFWNSETLSWDKLITI